jgi:hypothetical protein
MTDAENVNDLNPLPLIFPFLNRRTINLDYGVIMATVVVLHLMSYSDQKGFLNSVEAMKAIPEAKAGLLYKLIYSSTFLDNIRSMDIEQTIMELIWTGGAKYKFR